MKRQIVLILALAILAGASTVFGQGATSWNINRKPTSDWWSGSSRDIAWRWAQAIDRLVAGGGQVGTGSTFYVDSGVTNEGDGSSWSNAKDTLDEAIGLCTAGRGDFIYVAQGHTETMGAAADEVDIDVDDITIIGLGNGLTRPTFDYTDYETGAFAIGADDVAIYNLRFHANTPDVNDAIDLEAGSAQVSIVGCLFDAETEGTDEFHECIDSGGAASDRLVIQGCEFYMAAGAARSAIALRDSDYAQIVDNKFAGDYAIADVNNAITASNHITIAGNEIVNGTIGGAAGLNDQPCIELKSDTSGVIAGNLLVTNVATPDAAIVGADMYCIGNAYSETEGGVSSAPMWLTTDTLDNKIGVDDSANLGTTANVTADADGSILERLEQIDVDTSAIATDTAAMDTAGELSLLADPNKVTYDAPRLISDLTGAMGGGDYEAADDPTIFTVTGDIMCRAFAIVNTNVTSTSTDTLELGVAGDTACLLVQDQVDGSAFVANDVWTLDQAADTPSAECSGEWVVIPNGLDIILTINDHDITAGVIEFYLQWIPLSADAAVVGAAP